ncbi:MAG: glycine cleavage system protein GcvH [Cyclobacteriaceae bacterium]|nr:glycine cleavage system protein GcvH [Cyclobacteriaceae bacterium]
MNIPADLKYTKDHEWIKIEGNAVIIGITEFAAKELGDIVFIEVDTVGEEVASGDVFGTIEAVKTVSDLFMPITGTIDEFNDALEDSPEAINQNAYEAWIVKVTMQEGADLSELMDADAYKKIIGQ